MTTNRLAKSSDDRPKLSKQEQVDAANQHLMMIGRKDVHWFINEYGKIEIDWIRR